MRCLIPIAVRFLTDLIGGGLALGTIVLVKEDTPTMLHSVLQRYFVAEGVSHRHKIISCAPGLDAAAVVRVVPQDSSAESAVVTPEDMAIVQVCITLRLHTCFITVADAQWRPYCLSPHRTQSMQADSLKIAWRYQQQQPAMSLHAQAGPSASSAWGSAVNPALLAGPPSRTGAVPAPSSSAASPSKPAGLARSYDLSRKRDSQWQESNPPVLLDALAPSDPAPISQRLHFRNLSSLLQDRLLAEKWFAGRQLQIVGLKVGLTRFCVFGAVFSQRDLPQQLRLSPPWDLQCPSQPPQRSMLRT